MFKKLVNVVSNVSAEKGVSAVSKAVGIAKRGGGAYKQSMSTSGMGDRMSDKMAQKSKKIADKIGAEDFVNLSEAEQKALKDRYSHLNALGEDLRGQNSASGVANRIAKSRAIARDFESPKVTLGDYAVAGKEVAKDYFWTGATTGQKATRIGTVAATYGAGAGTIRYVTGGSMTRNSKGERDIAGIPFM